jgi:hypothetical protein
MLPAAAQTYRRLLRQKERGDAPEYKEASARLAAVTENLKRLREAERHEKRGLAVLNKLSEIASKSGTAQPAADVERPDPARLQLALWDLKQAIALRPEEARYHYNLGLLYEHLNFGGQLNRENAERVKKEPRLLEEPVTAYKTAIEIDHRYLSPYARLGYLYEWQEKNDEALNFYKSLLAEAPNPRPIEVKEIEARVQTLEKRFFGNVGYVLGIDSNFTLSEPPQDDTSNTLSANLTYYLVRRPRFQIPLSYEQQTTFYYRVQTYFSSHGLSLGFQHRPIPSLLYGLTGRYQAGLLKNGGVAQLLSQGIASVTRSWEVPTVAASLEYGYTDVDFRHSSASDAQEQWGTLTLAQTFGWRDDASLSYTFNSRESPGSEYNSYRGHRLQIGYQRWILPELQFRASAAIFYQNFLHPELTPAEAQALINVGALPPNFDSNELRRTSLISYNVGLLYRWSETINLFIDYQWQNNETNLPIARIDRQDTLDLLQGKNPSVGDYEKRVLKMGVNVAF